MLLSRTVSNIANTYIWLSHSPSIGGLSPEENLFAFSALTLHFNTYIIFSKSKPLRFAILILLLCVLQKNAASTVIKSVETETDWLG